MLGISQKLGIVKISRSEYRMMIRCSCALIGSLVGVLCLNPAIIVFITCGCAGYMIAKPAVSCCIPDKTDIVYVPDEHVLIENPA